MKILKERDVYIWRHLKFVELDYIKPDWNLWKWEKLSRNFPWVVWALVENIDNNSFVFVEQFRPPVNKKVLELVAWVIDKSGKTNEQIITEEILEETGYIVKNIEFIMSWPKSPWLTDEISYDYYAQVSWTRWKQSLWDSEDIRVIEIEKNDLESFLSHKEKSWVLVSPSIYSILYKILTTRKINIK